MGLVVRIREPEDVGEALTKGYIRKLTMIHTGILAITSVFALIFVYCLFSIDLPEASSSVVNAVGLLGQLTVAVFVVWGVFILLYYDIDGAFMYRDMPQSMCEEVLQSLDKYNELEFLKERIASMDRKLTIEEGLYITNYHKVRLERQREEYCKKLYGIR